MMLCDVKGILETQSILTQSFYFFPKSKDVNVAKNWLQMAVAGTVYQRLNAPSSI